MLFTILCSITLFGFLLLFYSFIRNKSALKFISFSILFVIYLIGWQQIAHSVSVRTQIDKIEEYQYLKTNDFHVVIYIPKEHTVYIRDEAEFYNTTTGPGNKPLITRTRNYDIYDNMLNEELVVTPILPEVVVIGKRDTVKNKGKVIVKYILASKVNQVKNTAAITYPYEVIDKGESKKLRIIEKSIVKRFLRSSVKQVVLTTAANEFYVVKFTKNKYVAGKISDSYDIQHEITILYTVTIDEKTAMNLK